MPVFDFECEPCHGRLLDQLVLRDAPAPLCPLCGLPLTKLFNFSPGWNETTIRTVSERDPRYFAWLNSDSVKADLASGKLRPVRKGEDIAHGGGEDSDYEPAAETRKRFEGYERDFINLGCPTVEEQKVLQSQGKM